MTPAEIKMMMNIFLKDTIFILPTADRPRLTWIKEMKVLEACFFHLLCFLLLLLSIESFLLADISTKDDCVDDPKASEVIDILKKGVGISAEPEQKEIKCLLRKGVDIDFQDSEGNTALIIAAKNNFEKISKFLSTYEDQIDGKRADLNKVNSNGSSALMWAAFSGHYEVAKSLIHQGANVDIRDNTGASALIWAAERGKKEVALMLIQRGCNLDYQDSNGKTALIWSAIYGDEDVARSLIQHGANTQLRSEVNKSALIYAKRYANIEIAQALVKFDEASNSMGGEF